MSAVGLTTPAARAADVIEFLSGAKVAGKVTQIDKIGRKITFELKIGGRTLTRIYPYSKIHAVTYRGKRYILNPQTGRPNSPPTGSNPTGRDRPRGSPAPGRTRAEIEALIEQAGRTPPDWLDDTPLDYPPTLDLSWPQPPPKGWNNKKNVGQYLWDIINPNPQRWRSGVHFMHYLLALHKDDPELRTRVMKSLGAMYFNFFQDYARAAYWWQQARVTAQDPASATLAECYWRLGNKPMAVDLLTKLERSTHGGVLTHCVKVWGDMGNIQKARSLADRLVPAYHTQGFSAGHILLLVGDAYRNAGRYQDATRYYRKALQESDQLKGHVKQSKDRARANIETIKLFEQSDVSRVADGTYQASSLGYQGQVYVEVEVQRHRITSVRVTRHKEKQFYSALTDVPKQIIQKQGVQGVDTTSRATVTAEAIINATAKALANGAQ